MEKISVIIPIYNVEKYLKRCIESVLNQTYKNFELILIDDGSEDNSGYIADRYAKLDGRVTVKHIENSGSSAARNTGLEMSTGEYVAFIDSDDYVTPDYLDTMQRNMTEDVDLVLTQAKYINENGEPVYVLDPPLEIDTTYDDVRNYMGRNRHFWACMSLYRRSVIGEQRFETKYHVGEDVLFVFSYMRKARKIRHLSKRMYTYVLYKQSACHGVFSDKKFTEMYVWRDICNMNADVKKVYRVCRGEYGRRAFRLYNMARKSAPVDEEKLNELRRIMRYNFFYYLRLKGYKISKKARRSYALRMLGIRY